MSTAVEWFGLGKATPSSEVNAANLRSQEPGNADAPASESGPADSEEQK